MEIKSITNATQDEMIMYYMVRGEGGEFVDMPPIRIPARALAHSVAFPDSYSFECFYNTHKGYFDRGELLLTEEKEDKVMQINEEIEKANFEKSTENATNTMGEIADSLNGSITLSVTNTKSEEVVSETKIDKKSRKAK